MSVLGLLGEGFLCALVIPKLEFFYDSQLPFLEGNVFKLWAWGDSFLATVGGFRDYQFGWGQGVQKYAYNIV